MKANSNGKCLFCGEIVSDENFGVLGNGKVCCNKIKCLKLWEVKNV